VSSRQEGILSFYGGMGSVVMISIPSHALYFATYEYIKEHAKLNMEVLQAIGHGMAWLKILPSSHW
jgi:hypothetical protein